MKKSSFLFVALAAAFVAPATAQVVTNMTPERVKEAIAAGQANKKAGIHTLSTKGIIVGSFSTPFSRVASASRQAKATYKPFTEADVTPEMIAPQLEVFASAVGVNRPLPPGVGNVQAVVLMPKGAKDLGKAIQPTKTSDVSEAFRNMMGANLEGKSVLAVFPLEALAPGREVVVVYDRIVGRDYLSKCTECRVELDAKGVR